jgi:hypothetical protein
VLSARVGGQVSGRSRASSRGCLTEWDVKISRKAMAALVKETRRTPSHRRKRLVSADVLGAHSGDAGGRSGFLVNASYDPGKRLVLLPRLSVRRAIRTRRRFGRSSWVKCRVRNFLLKAADDPGGAPPHLIERHRPRPIYLQAHTCRQWVSTRPNRAQGRMCSGHPAGTSHACCWIRFVAGEQAEYQRARLIARPRQSRKGTSRSHIVLR